MRAADTLTMSGYASNIIRVEKSAVSTGTVTTVFYAGAAAFNAAMSGPDIHLRKVTVYA